MKRIAVLLISLVIMMLIPNVLTILWFIFTCSGVLFYNYYNVEVKVTPKKDMYYTRRY
jgi:hypothetical protein